ncbi:type II toxin-antitoxin system prevent-host-death family antitoxin [Mesorhizobium sp.]|uniref:type II toxin-antitoxin system prevent-host-death family antitoxin n=1 Tax=Mesorhizobium sp. TaxID=1871066 RepID=UPI001204A7F4|nr:MAG: type II toxin-antitoxin system Phd/YefM family antitoxin [Mesorhizobium sp.]
MSGGNACENHVCERQHGRPVVVVLSVEEFERMKRRSATIRRKSWQWRICRAREK